MATGSGTGSTGGTNPSTNPNTNPNTGNVTTEDGGSVVFAVSLRGEVAEGVTVTYGCVSTMTTEGRPTPAMFSFTAANWSTPVSVTVTGVNDGLRDGNISYTVSVSVVGGPKWYTDAPTAIKLPLVNIDAEPRLFTIEPAVAAPVGFVITVSGSNFDSGSVTASGSATTSGGSGSAGAGASGFVQLPVIRIGNETVEWGSVARYQPGLKLVPRRSLNGSDPFVAPAAEDVRRRRGGSKWRRSVSMTATAPGALLPTARIVSTVPAVSDATAGTHTGATTGATLAAAVQLVAFDPPARGAAPSVATAWHRPRAANGTLAATATRSQRGGSVGSVENHSVNSHADTGAASPTATRRGSGGRFGLRQSSEFDYLFDDDGTADEDLVAVGKRAPDSLTEFDPEYLGSTILVTTLNLTNTPLGYVVSIDTHFFKKNLESPNNIAVKPHLSNNPNALDLLTHPTIHL
jgi:hypothetical protein